MGGSLPETAPAKRLLLVMHAPSPNTARLRDAIVRGAGHPDISGVATLALSPFDTKPQDVLAADAIILGTPENLGYMSGALKDFFDRCYYPLLEEKQGMPVGLIIRAGLDGTGTRRAIESIVTGLRWAWVQEPVVCKGPWQDAFETQAETLGMSIAAGLEAGIF